MSDKDSTLQTTDEFRDDFDVFEDDDEFDYPASEEAEVPEPEASSADEEGSDHSDPPVEDEEDSDDLEFQKWNAHASAEHAKQMRDRRAGKVRVQRVLLTILGIIAGAAVVIYLGGVIYFSGHFGFRTTLNGTDVSGKNAAQVENLLTQLSEDYTLTIHGRNDVDDTINGSDIALSIQCSTDLTTLPHSQSALEWPASLLQSTSLTDTYAVTYDETSLASQVEGLAFFQSDNIQQPANAICSYVDGSYQIVAGDKGSVPNETGILQTIQDALSQGLSEVTLGDDCYEKATLTEDNSDLQQAADDLNRIVNMTVTMTFGEETVTFSKDELASFVSARSPETSDGSAESGEENTADDSGETSDAASGESSSEDQSADGESTDTETSSDGLSDLVVFQTDTIAEYFAALAEKYDTYGKDREFKTHGGDTITVSGGNYGWQLDQEASATALIEFLTAGEDGEFALVWTKEAASFGDTDIGTSYMEVDLDKQKVYQYIDGECVVETDCVSGKAIDSDRLTPDGTYSIVYRKSPAVLKGADYESPVTYWMPFNGGIGFHDATWRSKFGGEIYLTGGSHGCVNLPLSAAKKIYANVYSGMPVVVYGGMTSEEAIEYTGKTPDPPVTQKESDADIGGGVDAAAAADSANAAATADTSSQASSDASSTQTTAVLQQAIQNYMNQGMSAEQAQAQVQADLAAQLAAQQAAAGQ